MEMEVFGEEWLASVASCGCETIETVADYYSSREEDLRLRRWQLLFRHSIYYLLSRQCWLAIQDGLWLLGISIGGGEVA
jgi:hypothetical protein